MDIVYDHTKMITNKSGLIATITDILIDIIILLQLFYKNTSLLSTFLAKYLIGDSLMSKFSRISTKTVNRHFFYNKNRMQIGDSS